METNVLQATEEYLRNRITELEERVKTVEESHARVVQRDFSTAAALNAMSSSLQEWTMENLENGNITEEQATELSEIGVFELTKEFELEVTVQYSITVNARNEEEAMNLIHDIDFDSVSEPQGVTYLSSTVDRIDL
jgi:hypothetical protein